MPSTFECPNCPCVLSRWISSTWDNSSGTQTTTYQCVSCLTLYDAEYVAVEVDKNEWERWEQWERASNEDMRFDIIDGNPRPRAIDTYNQHLASLFES